MTGHEKHNLLVVVFALFVVAGVPSIVFLRYAYWTAAKSVHIPDDILRSGPGLSGVSAIAGGVAGVGFTNIVNITGQSNFDNSMIALAYGIMFTILSAAIMVTAGTMIMRSGYRTPATRLTVARQRESSHFSPAALSREIRQLREEPYVTVAEKSNYLRYADEVSRYSRHLMRYYEKTSRNWLGFPAFVRMYVFDKAYRDRTGINILLAATCVLAIVAIDGGTWWLGAASTPGLCIASIVTVEALAWILMRWRYEIVRLRHRAEACLHSAKELRQVCEKKYRLMPQSGKAGRSR